MKEQLEKLVKLQFIDLEQERLRQDVEIKRKKVEDDEALLEELRHALDEFRQSFDETKKLAQTKRVELEEIKKGLETANGKLLLVTNSRDYAAAEREVENFKKMLGQVEDEILQLNSALNEGESKISSQMGNVEELEKEIQSSRKAVEKAAMAISSQIETLDLQSKEISKLVQAQILARYRFIRSRRAGVAVVSANDGTCSGCHMKLQPQAFIQLQKQISLECCQNCQRILYFEPQDGAQAHG